jgi:long-chain acyl-CoA synthetase
MGATIVDLFIKNVEESPDRVWLRNCSSVSEGYWSWRQASEEINSVSAWVERQVGSEGAAIGLLASNCAHWAMADLAIISSGNVTVPLFTSSPKETVEYVIEFSGVKILFVGRADNWADVSQVIDESVFVVTLPGVDITADLDASIAHIKWEEIVRAMSGTRPKHSGKASDVVSIIFTSGTTGLPKGVVQSHESMILPMLRHSEVYASRPNPRFLSYLPLAHIAERQLVLVQSLVQCAEISFNESLIHLKRDMSTCRPNFFFGAPRVWEQLREGILALFGSQELLNLALERDGEGLKTVIKASLGLQDADLLAVGSAPAPRELIQWFDVLGMQVLEGYGQTEAMSIAANTSSESRAGSIGKPYPGVELLVSDSGELLCKAEGVAVGYFKSFEDTAKTFVNGWVHTGDTARIDEDGFVYLVGRVKDYFKTIQGKFVSPYPIESAFQSSDLVDQVCLLGRGYSKTVIVCVLSEKSKGMSRDIIESQLKSVVEKINLDLERHARVGAALIDGEKWTINNTVLTPTLKIRREKIEELYGDRAEKLSRESAERKATLIEWC